MSRLNDLIRQVGLTDEALAADLHREFAALADRRSFGLNFERHVPEAVELPGRPVRRGDKIRVLPARGQTPTKDDDKLWRVTKIERAGAGRVAALVALTDGDDICTASVDDLVVVAEFRDPIYPGLVSTGTVERGGDKPFHTVINAENYHALQALLYTHRGKVDCIYIDPPYNTGAKDWKYNNDYVESDDLYRHSKWLAFMERRLLLAKELLNPDDSVLIVSIDIRELNRLGLLLQQSFPEGRIQIVSTVINPKGVSVVAGFRRSDEYVFFVSLGRAAPARLPLGSEWSSSAVSAGVASGESAPPDAGWTSMMRRGSNSARVDRPAMFYPIYADPSGPRIVEVGESLPSTAHEAPERPDLVTILPIRKNGSEGRWQVSSTELVSRLEQGRVRLGRRTAYGYVVNYLPDGAYAAVLTDQFEIQGRDKDGSLIAVGRGASERVAPTQWRIASHNASEFGSTLLSDLLGNRKFPFPKSLYAVEDAIRFFVADKPDATIIDFFAGSGTTAHAVMRLNKQDGGRRRCMSVTNNEVSADEQKGLRQQGLRPGDADWERHGICDYITKPRIEAAIKGITPDGEPIKGDYKFTDEFPMADGFKENVEFFTLTYEAPLRVASHRDFERIAPLLWLRAGSMGRRIDDMRDGWDVADAYGVLADLDQVDKFLAALDDHPDARLAFVVTDEGRLFEAVVRDLPAHVEPVRLYESYLRNFEIESGRGLR
ncbi:MAG TPA: DNA methyltransferase [Nocardioidaceae bacterium]|nr:DNA methyltransferase [Nocardioidaceae bacterium]